MTTRFRSPIATGCAAVALFAFGVLAPHPADAATARREANGAIRFYDDNGNDAGYAWCLRRDSGFWPSASGSDCSYFTLAQCRASIIEPMGGICEPNPWASQVVPEQRRHR
jgi:hypothetical protein